MVWQVGNELGHVHSVLAASSVHLVFKLLFVVQTELMRVDVETLSELSAGQTVCDIWHQSSKPKNVHVARVSLCINGIMSLG